MTPNIQALSETIENKHLAENNRIDIDWLLDILNFELAMIGGQSDTRR